MPNKKIILALVGQLASGKGTVSKYLCEHYKAQTFRFSDIMRDILTRLHLEINRKNMQDTSTMIREYFGEDIISKTIAEEVKNTKADIVAIDGVRRLADIKYLKTLPGFKLVRIVADPKIRYERLVKRAENAGDSAKSYKEFLSDEKRQADITIPEAMKKADIELSNDGTEENLKKQIDQILKNLSI